MLHSLVDSAASEKTDILKEKTEKYLEYFIKLPTFASANAEIAQLVEHNLAKVGVASSSLVFRSCSL